MIRLLAFVAMLGITLQTSAQKTLPFNAGDLHLEWELVQNLYQGKSQTLSKLRLHNAGKKKLPATGWALYFHLDRPVNPEPLRAAGIDAERLGGDWLRLKPGAAFAGLAAGARLELELVTEDWLIHRTDAPRGFYLVFDANPEKGYPVDKLTIVTPTRPEQLMRSADDKMASITPEKLYRQHEHTPNIPAAELRPVFPTPVSLTVQAGTYAVDRTTTISADPEFEAEARLLARQWLQWFGAEARVVRSSGEAHRGISLRKSADVVHAEGYHLAITPEKGIVISASGRAGIFYGMQSLKTILPPDLWKQTASSALLPCLEVRDEPRFAYRGLHVDVARNFQTKAEILKLLDVMALYKLNNLHFHFSDDEGWRIEIPGLPELTSVGGNRGHTTSEKAFLHPSYGSGPEPGKLYGSGYYSRPEFVEILQYATARHIEIIPEIELPGHARAAIKSMDARYERLMAENRPAEAGQYLLRDLEDQSVYKSVQGYNDNVVCVCQPSTLAFIDKVAAEFVAMYREAGAPLRTLHLGGDEVPGGTWERSPACLQLMREKAMKEPADLWYYFWAAMRDMMAKHGLYVSGWEEIGMRKTKLDGQTTYLPNPDFVDDNFHVYVWNNVLGWGAEDLAYRMANAGYQVVLAPVSNLYFDMAYHKDWNEPGYYWGAYTDVDKAFSFAPFDYYKTTREDRLGNAIDPSILKDKQRLTDYGKSNITGMQGLIWSETLRGAESIEYMVFPKLLGLAERAWSPAPDWETEQDRAAFERQYAASWGHFANQLGKRELPRLDYYAGGLHYRIPTPGAVVKDGKLLANIQLPGFDIRYTTDGSEPTLQSLLYTGPVAVKGKVQLRAFDKRGRGGRTVAAGE